MAVTGSSEDQDRLFCYGDEQKENGSGDDVVFTIPMPEISLGPISIEPIVVNKLMFVVVTIVSILIALGLMVTVIPGVTNQDFWIYKP